MKTCHICKIEKSLSHYNKNKTRKDGLQTMCKICSRERSRRYYSENGDNHRSYVRDKNRTEVSKKIAVDRQLKTECSVCGESEVACLDWHHVDPSQKEVHVGAARSSHFYSLRKMLKEIEKCVCVCANCHRKIHAGIIPCPPIDNQRIEILRRSLEMA